MVISWWNVKSNCKRFINNLYYLIIRTNVAKQRLPVSWSPQIRYKQISIVAGMLAFKDWTSDKGRKSRIEHFESWEMSLSQTLIYWFEDNMSRLVNTVNENAGTSCLMRNIGSYIWWLKAKMGRKLWNIVDSKYYEKYKRSFTPREEEEMKHCDRKHPLQLMKNIGIIISLAI